YINVIQIGDNTTGKNVGSITLYDSPDFTKEGSDPSHKYAMQPIVLKVVNKVGFGDYLNGLPPDTVQLENLANLGILGSETEPLLATAISQITGSGRYMPISGRAFETFKDSKSIDGLKNEMYKESLPEGLHHFIK
ncbi:MAG: peptidase S41, partial [Flavisolibacter sp.]|nr:peptidase S41 [Flavisolibacter sp.]